MKKQHGLLQKQMIVAVASTHVGRDQDTLEWQAQLEKG